MFSLFSTYYHLVQRAWVCLCWVSVEGESMTTTAQKGQKYKKKEKLRLTTFDFQRTKFFNTQKNHFQRPSRSH